MPGKRCTLPWCTSERWHPGLLQAPAHLQLARSQESGKASRPSRAPSFFVFHSFPFLLAPTPCLGFSSSGTPRKTSPGNLIVSENLGIIGKAAPHLQAVITR